MMQIIAGNLKGRQFDSPKQAATHPMSDKIRGALFNVLGDIDGLTVLDAFAGSGAISFEALSRGASRATLIESDRKAQKVIADNLSILNLQKEASFVSSSADNWLSRSEDQFDIVILDPPYDDLQKTTLVQLADRAKSGGIVVLSLPVGASSDLPSNFQLLSTKSYGDAQLQFYRAI
jgi:16S rRNA (guanine966-N2)-methyltransferase